MRSLSPEVKSAVSGQVITLAGYLLMAIVGMWQSQPANLTAPYWLASGAALLALVRGGPSQWVAVFAGAWLIETANLMFRVDDQSMLLSALLAGLGVALAATLQAALGYMLVAHDMRSGIDAWQTRLALRFAWRAAFLPCLVGALLSSVSLLACQYLSVEQWPVAWLNWWVSSSMGVLLFVPVLFLIAQRQALWLHEAETLQAKADLEARSTQLQSVMDTMEDGIVLIDERGLVHSMNRAALIMFGYDWAQVKGRNIKMLMPPHYAGLHDKHIADYLETGIKKIIGVGREVEGRRQDGSVFPLSLAVGETRINGQRMFTGVVRDVTARKQSEGMLDYFAAIVKSSSDAIMSRDIDGLITSWNPAAERMFGYARGEMLNQPVSRLIPEDEADLDAEVIASLMRGESVAQYETMRVRQDGSFFPVSCSLSSIRNVEGDVIGVAYITRDITDVRRQQAALKHSEETLRSAMEHAPIGMALLSPGGRWLRVNQALCDLLGYERESLLRQDFQSITHPDDLEQESDLIMRALEGSIKTYQIEKRFFHRSGRIVWVQMNMSIVLQDNAILPYFIAQITDITARLEVERLKSEFISIVSHELRTPLTSIRGALGLIMGAMQQEVSERAGRLIGIAHSNCERLIVLINDILDIDKIASGEMRFEKTPRALAPIVRQAIDGMAAYAEQFGVRVGVSGELDEQVSAEVDAGRLMQVLANFLSNAVKFSPRDGLVDVALTVHGSHVRIAVMDQGPGIPEEFRSRIFGKFMQADSTVTRAKGGTGLGLHIGKQIVEHMGGQVGFDSELGRGSTFWLELPVVSLSSRLLAPAAQADVPRVAALPHGVALPRVLHVEDDGDFGLVVAEALRGRVDVQLARTLGEARSMLRKGSFDLLLLDLVMPDGNGLDLLDEWPHEGDEALPAVVLSVSEVSDDVRRRVRAALVKSRVSDGMLTDTIMQCVRQHEMA